jgi:hypothetical protein
LDILDHYLTDILISGLHGWFTGTQLNKTWFPQRYHPLIKEQTEIGWCHLFKGPILLQWSAKQDVWQQKTKALTHTGARWSRYMLTILWMDFFSLWKAHNEAIHGHSLSSQQQAH